MCPTDIDRVPRFWVVLPAAAAVGMLGDATSGSPSSDDMSVSTLCSSLLDRNPTSPPSPASGIGSGTGPPRPSRSGAGRTELGLLANFFPGRIGLPAADPTFTAVVEAPVSVMSRFTVDGAGWG